MIRSFIAISVPAPARAAVAALVEPLRGAGDVRWVAAEQYHLTLKFLGDATEDQLGQVGACLRELAKKRSRFVIQLGGVGAFPRADRPRILWAGMREGEATLIALAREVEEACAAAGFSREGRPYNAHLTLGRVRSPRDLPALAARLRAGGAGDVPPFDAEELLVMESRLRPDGPVYSVLERCRLGEGEQRT